MAKMNGKEQGRLPPSDSSDNLEPFSEVESHLIYIRPLFIPRPRSIRTDLSNNAVLPTPKMKGKLSSSSIPPFRGIIWEEEHPTIPQDNPGCMGYYDRGMRFKAIAQEG